MINSSNTLDYLKQICSLHEVTKEYLIRCEELHKETLLQPVKEFRDAYDHLLQTFFKDEDDESVKHNLNSALSHEFRAFIDTMDYFSLILKEIIWNETKKISDKQLVKLYPQYNQMRLFILNSIDKTTAIRMDRNSLERDKIVHEYCSIVDEMYRYYKEFINAISSNK